MAEAPSQSTDRLRSMQFRDGLIIALLAARPLRLRNLVDFVLDRTVVRRAACWWITIPGEETKTHEPIEAPFPDALCSALDVYLHQHRPVLCGLRCGWARDDVGGALRVSGVGPLGRHGIYGIIVPRTAEAFGRSVNPHLFRDCAATSIAIEDPEHVRIANPRAPVDRHHRALLQPGAGDRRCTALSGLPCRAAQRQDDRRLGDHAELMRAAVYARYSSDLQSACSIEDQVRLCRTRIGVEGWSLVNTYTDHALSGASRLRPGYQKLLEDARAGTFDIVVAEALDRLSRDQEGTAALYKQLGFAGVRLLTLAEGDISELHVGLKGTMNALFLKDLAMKTRRGLEGRVRLGRSGRGLCYGYKTTRETDTAGNPIRGGRLIEDGEAEVVRRIFREYAAGRSPRQIARRLNAEGVSGPRRPAMGRYHHPRSRATRHRPAAQ
jgi:DNA invertase Pin-like site-specific DNA recombinase